MEELLFTKIPVVATLTAVFFLLTAAQTLHALFLAARKNARPVSAASMYEALLVVHLYLATATMLSAYANHGTLLMHLRVTALPLSALLWFNLALAVMGLALAIRYRKPVMTWEIVLFALCSPPVIDAAGTFAPYLFIARRRVPDVPRQRRVDPGHPAIPQQHHAAFRHRGRRPPA